MLKVKYLKSNENYWNEHNVTIFKEYWEWFKWTYDLSELNVTIFKKFKVY